MKTMNTVQASPGLDPSSARLGDQKTEGTLQELIPIVMVIVGGCETCAEKMVTRALNEGCDWRDIDRTLRITAAMQKLDCFANAVGPEVVSRMDKPLAAGRKTLELAKTLRSAATCGCGGE